MQNSKTGILIPNDKLLRDVLNEMGARVDDYHYLPFWFKVTERDTIAYHINNLPEDLKEEIQGNRQELIIDI